MPKKYPPRVSIFRIYGLLTGAILLCVILFILFYSGGGAQILLVEQAALKETSLFTLAQKCGIQPPEAFVQHFIDYDREVRDKWQTV